MKLRHRRAIMGLLVGTMLIGAVVPTVASAATGATPTSRAASSVQPTTTTTAPTPPSFTPRTGDYIESMSTYQADGSKAATVVADSKTAVVVVANGHPIAAQSGPGTVTQHFGHQTEAGCATITTVVSYVSSIFFVHITEWHFNLSTHYCWHWKSYHTVATDSHLAWWDHIDGLAWSGPKVDGYFFYPFSYESGYSRSGYVLNAHGSIAGCLIRFACLVIWTTINEVHLHDDGTVVGVFTITNG